MQEAPAVRILIVISSEGQVPPGTLVPETIVRCYYHLREVGAEVVFTSEQGGFPEVAGQMRSLPRAPEVDRFLSDDEARNDIADVLPLDSIFVEEFDAAVAFYLSRVPSRMILSMLQALVGAGVPVALPPWADVSAFSGRGAVHHWDGGSELKWAEALLRT